MTSLRQWATPLTIGMFVLMAVTGLLSHSGPQQGARPTARLVSAVMNASLANVAALQGVTPEEVIAKLTKAGIQVTDPQQSLAALFPQKSQAQTP